MQYNGWGRCLQLQGSQPQENLSSLEGAGTRAGEITEVLFESKHI